MREAVQRHVVLVVGVIVSGLLVSLAVPALISPRGATGPTVLDAMSPAGGVVVSLLALLGAAVLGGVVGRLINAAVGTFVLGAGVFVLSMSTATMQELAFAGGSAGSLWVETLLWAALSLPAVGVVFAIAGPLPDVQPTEAGERPHPLWSAAALKSAVGGLTVLPVVAIVAQSTSKGQAFAAAWVGSIVAGLIGRLISPHVQPLLLMVSPIVFGAAGHVIGAIMLDGPLDLAVVADAVPHLLIPMPVDYAAGALAGVPIGLGWAVSFLHHEE